MKMIDRKGRPGRKLLAAILAVAMLLTFMPGMAFADGGTAAAALGSASDQPTDKKQDARSNVSVKAAALTAVGKGDIRVGQVQQVTFTVSDVDTPDPNATVSISYFGPKGSIGGGYTISPAGVGSSFNYDNGSRLTITHTPDWDGSYNMAIIVFGAGGDPVVQCPYNFSVKPATETITFDANGGSSSEDTRVDVNVITEPTFSKLPYAWRPNYTFLGWFTEQSGGIQVNVGDSVEASPTYTYYAHWNIDRYTVFFDSAGGTTVAPRVRDYNTEIGALPPAPERAGYTFEGWYDSDGTKITEAYKVTNSTTLYAKWVADESYEFTVTYVDRASVLRSEAYLEGETVHVFAGSLDRVGYTFGGWEEVGTDNLYPRGGAFKITGATTLRAKWAPIAYDIYYELDGGTNAMENPESYTIESPAIPLANPSRDGYLFSGWFRDAAFANRVVGPAIPQGSTGEKTFYAKWTVDNTRVEGTNNPNGVVVEPKAAVKSVITAVKTIYVQKGKTVKIPYVAYAKTGFSGKVAATWSVSKTQRVSVNSANPKTKKGKITTGKLGAKSVIKVKGKKNGTIKLVVKAGTKALWFKIVVVKSKKAVKNFKTNKVTKLKAGKSKIIKIARITKKATGNVALFTIAKKYQKYLKVDAAGKLTAVKVYKNGKKTIPVKIKVGKKTKIIRVKVTKK